VEIRNINPLGEVEDLALGVVVEADAIVDVPDEVAVERVSTGNYEPVDTQAFAALLAPDAPEED